MTKKISAVCAQDVNGVIGKNQTLPWRMPADLQHFKETTMGHVMVMGRVTFDGMGGRVLPNRTSIILTRDKNFSVDHQDVKVMHSVQEILDWYEKQEQNLYVIGGAQVFRAFEPYLDEIILTDIHDEYEGDTYFPSDFDWSHFEEVGSVFRPKDEKNASDFTVKYFARKVI